MAVKGQVFLASIATGRRLEPRPSPGAKVCRAVAQKRFSASKLSLRQKSSDKLEEAMIFALPLAVEVPKWPTAYSIF